ncbi:hypothetical protein L2E82_37577 [Cichorium intybus]|uniref:Uncharacterized protein n=1 Tax=Cichorium intybus TaxID=13427 RepID=A0ACB9AGA9_CICIN|nr:hypothetical protein L2E82_37577 [Cichorium intybus]
MESKLKASSSPGNPSLKRKNKMLEQNKILSVKKLVKTQPHKISSGSAKLLQDSRKIQMSSNVAGTSSNLKQQESNEVLRKYRDFKKFDIVEDYSDHHYKGSNSSKMQASLDFIEFPPKNWAKTIQQEWKILEKDLPDTIFVRAYESRMDLLRAVIIGAQGTPYHDGLFFFDVCFPYNYPTVPPLSGSRYGDLHSMQYNERTLILSLKTMVYSMKNPPRHFEDLVIGHFHDRAVTILTICRGYSKGVWVGANGVEVKGSKGFGKNVEQYMGTIVGAFKAIGVEDVDEFVPKLEVKNVDKSVTQSRSLAQKIRAFFGYDSEEIHRNEEENETCDTEFVCIEGTEEVYGSRRELVSLKFQENGAKIKKLVVLEGI